MDAALQATEWRQREMFLRLARCGEQRRNSAAKKRRPKTQAKSSLDNGPVPQLIGRGVKSRPELVAPSRGAQWMRRRGVASIASFGQALLSDRQFTSIATSSRAV